MKQKAITTVSMRQGSLGQLLAPPARPVEQRGRLLLMLLLFLPCLFLFPALDNDLWFLLASGRYVLSNGIPMVEPFTMHHNMAFVMQQWLSSVVFWLVYSNLGAYGIFALTCIVFACIVLVTYRMAMLLSNHNFLAAFLATMPVSVLLTQFLFTRPIMFTLLILLSELYFLERFIAAKKPVWLLPLPILSALLINLHAAMWPMQFVLLLPYVVDSFRFQIGPIRGQGYDKRSLFAAILLVLAAGFCNPYGLRAMTYLFRSYGYAEFGQINEMKPANINLLLGMVIFASFFGILAVYLFRQQRTTKLRYALLTFGTAILALSSIRNFVVFIICGIVPLSYILRDIHLPVERARSARSALRLRTILIVLFAIGILYLAQAQVVSLRKASLPPPVAAPIDYLLQENEPGDVVLYTGYNDGAYAEFMGFSPYIDPRAEVFVPKNNGTDNIIQEYFQLQSGGIYYKDVLNKYRFTHLLVDKDDLLNAYLLQDPDYERVYYDEAYAVFQRK